MREYVDNIHEIYQKCDLITLHMPLFEFNFHMIDESALSQMKRWSRPDQYGKRRPDRSKSADQRAGVRKGWSGRSGCD